MGAFFLPSYKNCYPVVLSEKGLKLERTAKIDVTRSISLKFGAFSLPIIERTRAYDTEIKMEKMGHGDSWESWLVNKHANTWTEGVKIDSFSGHIHDKFTEKRSTMYFLDLRTDVAAWRTTETVITLATGVVQLPDAVPKTATNLFPDPKYWQFLKFPGTKITKTVTVSEHVRNGGTTFDVYQGKPVVTSWTQDMTINFSNGFLPDIAHLQELLNYYQWQPYILDGEVNSTPDGYDFFRPEWLPLDALDKWDAEEFRGLAAQMVVNNETGKQSPPQSVIIESFHNREPVGSWATDYGGNFFMAQKTFNGGAYGTLQAKGASAVEPGTVMPDAGTYYYPIAPV